MRGAAGPPSTTRSQVRYAAPPTPTAAAPRSPAPAAGRIWGMSSRVNALPTRIRATASTPSRSTSCRPRSRPTEPPPRRAATTETAIFAGGCFWGVEYLLEQQPGVLSVEAGYTGGRTDRPTYEEVCSHTTGHAEAVRVTFDTSKVSYETLATPLLEIHDPTQIDRQGPDIGDQYRSEIFYTSPEQRAVAERLIALLRSKGYRVATRVTPAGPFWPAETCHQDYYRRRGTLPYCHAYTRRF